MRAAVRWAAVAVAGLILSVQIAQTALVDRALLAERPAAALPLDRNHGDAAAGRAAEVLAGGKLVEAEALILNSIRADPLNPKGITLLGILRDQQERDSEALAAFAVAGSLGWRNQAAQQMIALKAAEQGDLRLAVVRVDALLRQYPTPQLIEFLRRVASLKSGRDALLERLAADPPWAYRFFNDLSSLQPAEYGAHEAILAEMPKSGGADTAANMRPYVKHLIASGQHDRAAALWRQHHGSSPDGFLRDPEFTDLASPEKTQSLFPWTLRQQPGGRVHHDATSTPFSRNSIRVEVEGSVAGALLEKMLALPSGSYLFSSYAREENGGSLGDLEWTVSCQKAAAKADNQKTEITPAQNGWLRLSRRFIIPPAGCPVQKLELRVFHSGPNRIAASFAAPKIASREDR